MVKNLGKTKVFWKSLAGVPYFEGQGPPTGCLGYLKELGRLEKQSWYQMSPRLCCSGQGICGQDTVVPRARLSLPSSLWEEG